MSRPRLGQSPLSLRLLALLVGVTCALLLYATAEALYRVHRYRTLRSSAVLQRVRLMDAQLVRLDREIGFRYFPGARVRQIIVDSTNRAISENRIRVNAAGHISTREDLPQKPPGEYRIAVIGDSFTACTFNNQPWPDLLEDRLNQDRDLVSRFRGAHFKVLNFGMEGTGFAQWAAVYEHEVARFEPDLVALAFIENDVWREFRWMDTVEPYPGAGYGAVLISTSLPVAFDNPRALLARQVVMSAEQMEDPLRRQEVVRAIVSRRVSTLPWTGLYPELLGILLAEAGLPSPVALRPRLEYTPQGPNRWRVASGQRAAALQVRELAGRTSLLLLHLPTQPELSGGASAPEVERLRQQTSGLTWLSLLARLRPLAGAAGDWFVPNNSHLSDHGAAVYAAAVHGELRDVLLRASPPVGANRATP